MRYNKGIRVGKGILYLSNIKCAAIPTNGEEKDSLKWFGKIFYVTFVVSYKAGKKRF